jgi:hypothetical protein
MHAKAAVRDCQLSGNQYCKIEFRNVPFTDGRGVKYPARKLMLVIRNNVLISTIPACPFSGDQIAQCIAIQLLGGCLGCIE